MHRKEIYTAGADRSFAKKFLIMLHGRGASAEDILTLGDHLDVKEFARIAPQATGRSWYPYSFLAPKDQNEPWLTSSLELIEGLVAELRSERIKEEDIYFAGFSQGACLALEFTARNARRWGGIVAFTGGLIGEKIIEETYKGDFRLTPVYIGTSDPDPHVPVERVNETAAILRSMNADLKVDIFRQMGHTIIPDEIEAANEHVFRKNSSA